MKNPESNPHVRRILAREYRTLNLKTVEPVQDMADKLNELHPDALIAFVRHEPEDGVPHYHLVARFPSPTNVKRLLLPIAEKDPCFYCAPCRLFRSSYRYLAHLDSPEKHKVPVDSIVRLGDWDTIPLCEWHLVRRQSVDLAELQTLCRDFLLEQGPAYDEYGDLRILPKATLFQFGLWLEEKGFNARSALSSLRVMGISFEDLKQEAASLIEHKDRQ